MLAPQRQSISLVQGKGPNAGSFNVQLSHEFTLKAGMGSGHVGAAADLEEHATSVIRALLVRLSIVKCIMPDSATAHVTGLNASEQLVITVRATGVVGVNETGDDVRQKFLLAVHRALNASSASVAPVEITG